MRICQAYITLDVQFRTQFVPIKVTDEGVSTGIGPALFLEFLENPALNLLIQSLLPTLPFVAPLGNFTTTISGGANRPRPEYLVRLDYSFVLKGLYRGQDRHPRF